MSFYRRQGKDVIHVAKEWVTSIEKCFHSLVCLKNLKVFFTTGKLEKVATMWWENLKYSRKDTYTPLNMKYFVEIFTYLLRCIEPPKRSNSTTLSNMKGKFKSFKITSDLWRNILIIWMSNSRIQSSLRIQMAISILTQQWFAMHLLKRSEVEENDQKQCKHQREMKIRNIKLKKKLFIRMSRREYLGGVIYNYYNKRLGNGRIQEKDEAREDS